VHDIDGPIITWLRKFIEIFRNPISLFEIDIWIDGNELMEFTRGPDVRRNYLGRQRSIRIICFFIILGPKRGGWHEGIPDRSIVCPSFNFIPFLF